MRTTTALGLGLLLAGCATAKPPAWVPAEGTWVAANAGFEVDGPPGWMRRNASHEVFTVTRDGTTLQRIVAGATAVGKPVGFGSSKRPWTAGMSPAELGELVADDLGSAKGLTDVQLLENAPAQLAGRPGFRVVATFADEGLRHRGVIYGAAEGARLFWIFYVAPERHYFDLDLPTFERAVGTFRIRSAPPAPAPAPPPAS
jgi:hypothetical protein